MVSPDMVVSIDQALPLFSNTKSNLSPQQEKRPTSRHAGSFSSKNSNPVPVDTVEISAQLQQAITDVQKANSVFTETGRKESIPANSSASGLAVAKVEIAYDLKGAVITKYLDSASRLVYQTPSELMVHLKEFAPKSDASVNTKA